MDYCSNHVFTNLDYRRELQSDRDVYLTRNLIWIKLSTESIVK